MRVIVYLKQVYTFWMVFSSNLSNEFYMHLEERFNGKQILDAETKVKSQDLFVAYRSLENILAFSAVFNSLESLKPLVKKSQKWNQDIYMAYRMIDLVMSYFKRYLENIDQEFKAWYYSAMTMSQSIDVQPIVTGLAKRWSQFGSNIEHDAPKSYYKRAVIVPFLVDINSNLQYREIIIFALLPSVILTNNYNINEAIELSFQGYKNEIVNGGFHFSTEVYGTTRRFNLWNNKSYQNKQKVDTTQK